MGRGGKGRAIREEGGWREGWKEERRKDGEKGVGKMERREGKDEEKRGGMTEREGGGGKMERR